MADLLLFLWSRKPALPGEEITYLVSPKTIISALERQKQEDQKSKAVPS